MATRKKKVREATCTYGNHGNTPSSPSLAFFNSRAAGSAWAKRTCNICNYAIEAHAPEVASKPHLKGRTNHKFVEHFGRETDEYYCGCYGWE